MRYFFQVIDQWPHPLSLFWQADAAFAAKEYIIAASFYAKVTPILLFVSLLNLLLFMLSYLHWG
jgi:hypothetical protein